MTQGIEGTEGTEGILPSPPSTDRERGPDLAAGPLDGAPQPPPIDDPYLLRPPPPVPERGRAPAGIALGVLLALSCAGALGLGYWAWGHHQRADPADDEPAAMAAATASPSPPAPPAPRAPRAADAEPFAPKYTKVHREGGVTVVDVGLTAPDLAAELAKQRAEAAAARETLLVMTTANGCDPCRGVDRSLADPRLQTALAGVRLVRLDIEVFHDDLDALKLRHEGIPGFFLLAPDLTPRDGVTGAEWDDDIPVNIAPVLGPFVRGRYTRRREPWRAVPPSGIAL